MNCDELGIVRRTVLMLRVLKNVFTEHDSDTTYCSAAFIFLFFYFLNLYCCGYLWCFSKCRQTCKDLMRVSIVIGCQETLYVRVVIG